MLVCRLFLCGVIGKIGVATKTMKVTYAQSTQTNLSAELELFPDLELLLISRGVCYLKEHDPYHAMEELMA